MAITNLANVKAFKNITDDAHDAELARLIPVVQAFVEQYCQRTLEQATVTEYFSTEPGQDVLIVRRPPIGTITSLYDDPLRAYGASTLIASTDYVVTDAEAGILRFPSRETSGGVNNMKLTYLAGYAPTRGELALLEQAAIELVWLARDKGDGALLGLSSRNIADSSITIRNDWPAGVEPILNMFELRH